NAAAHECRQLGDHGTASLFDAMVMDEESHGDWFEAQLQAVQAIGIQAYLARQVDPASAP
ncbi:MAG: bacterioferritin, partial [Candidatus Nanopelagicales bacterium]